MKAPNVIKNVRESRKSLPGITKKLHASRNSLGNVKLEKKSKAFLNLNVKDAEKQAEVKVKYNGKLKPVTPKVTSPEVQLGLKIDELLAKKTGASKGSLAEETPVKSKLKVDTSEKEKSENNSKETVQIASKIDLNELLEPVKAVLKMEGTKNSLLGDSKKNIFLQIARFHVKKESKIHLRIPIKHSLIDDTSDICFFTSDVTVDPEITVEYFKDLLEKNGVTSIKEIIPFKTFRREYSQFEEKRKLSNRFDFFLVEGKVAGMFFGLLGKHFIRKRKAPMPIRLTNNISQEIKDALSTTIISFVGSGNCCAVQVGHCGMTAEQIRDNIYSVCEGIDQLIPSLSSGIKSIMVKGESTVSFPIYVSLDIPSSPDKMVTEKKLCSPIKGELSTKLDSEVLVYPSGNVVVVGSTGNKGEKRKSPEMRNDDKKMKVEERNSPLPKDNDNDDDLSDDSDEEIPQNAQLDDKEDVSDISETEELYLKELAEAKANIVNKQKKLQSSLKNVKKPKQLKKNQNKENKGNQIKTKPKTPLPQNKGKNIKSSMNKTKNIKSLMNKTKNIKSPMNKTKNIKSPLNKINNQNKSNLKGNKKTSNDVKKVKASPVQNKSLSPGLSKNAAKRMKGKANQGKKG